MKNVSGLNRLSGARMKTSAHYVDQYVGLKLELAALCYPFYPLTRLTARRKPMNSLRVVGGRRKRQAQRAKP